MADDQEREWFVSTDEPGKPYGWTENGDVFAVYFDKKRGGYLPLTRRRWLRNHAASWLQNIGAIAGFAAWAIIIGALNRHGHPSWGMLILAAPIFYVLGWHHGSNK